jgi:hypothetical protein
MDRCIKAFATACLAMLIAYTAESSPNFGLSFATCVGANPCNACSSCRYCKHCAKEGGTCGVCARR